MSGTTKPVTNDPDIGRGNYTQDLIIEELQMMAHIIGRLPTTEEFTNCEHTCTAPTISHHFDGGWPELVRKAGYETRSRWERPNTNL